MVPIHPVLTVTTADSERVIMDDALRQYLWALSTWLQSWAKRSAKRLDDIEGRDSWRLGRTNTSTRHFLLEVE
jgi:hypothetical protein